LLWVQATLVHSAVAGYRALVGPLSPEDADAYYQDTKELGVLLGVPRDIYPASIQELDAYQRSMIERREVVVEATAREMARVVLRPHFGGVPQAAFLPLRVITAGLLPPDLRHGYGFRWGSVERAAFRACRAITRRLTGTIPPSVRYLPSARQAYRRLRLEGGLNRGALTS
jgi:uncharacterized protein (DUF2236 family)